VSGSHSGNLCGCRFSFENLSTPQRIKKAKSTQTANNDWHQAGGISEMTAWGFVLLMLIAFAAVWVYFAKRPGPRAKIGPDGTNVREPETFVVHHEGKGQGIDISNTALKERTEEFRRDLPGQDHKIKAPIPGRSMTQMGSPPSDISKYGDVKVAPGATPGIPGAESKETVLTKGPIGSRPETPEEPGSPFAMGRRVTDNHRDVELAADLNPSIRPGTGPRNNGRVASPSTNGQEPGYGLGRTRPGETDGEMPAASVPQIRSWDAMHEEVHLPDATLCEEGIVAMVRNPRSLYAYWGETGAREGGQDAYHCLKVSDLTTGKSYLVPISEDDDHWFINEGIEPGHQYIVSHGWQLPNGQFNERAASDPVETPPSTPSPASLKSEYVRHSAHSSPWR